MNIFWGEPHGDEIRTNMIQQINNLRNILNTIMNEIFSQISNIYSDKMSSTEFNNMVNDINSKFEQMNENKKKYLMNLDYIINMRLILIFILMI